MRARICNAIAFLLCVAIIGPLVYMITDDKVPFVRGTGRIVNSAQPEEDPRPGAAVEVIWENNKRKRDCEGYVFRKIIDSHGVVFTIEGVPVTYMYAKTQQSLIRFFRLPLGAAPGPAKYIATSHFYCNPLHRWWPIVVDVPHIDFTIAEPAPGPQGIQGIQGERGLPGFPGVHGNAGTCSGTNEGQLCRER